MRWETMGENIQYLSNGGCRISDVILDRLDYGFDLLKRGVTSEDLQRLDGSEAAPSAVPGPRRRVNVHGLLTEGADLLVAAVRALHGMRTALPDSDCDLIRDAIADVRGAVDDAELMDYDVTVAVRHTAESKLDEAQRLFHEVEGPATPDAFGRAG